MRSTDISRRTLVAALLLTAWAMVAPSVAQAAPTLVQHKVGFSNASGTTGSVTMTSTGAGRLLVVGVAAFDSGGARTVSSVTDNLGTNTYVQATSALGTANVAGPTMT